VFNLSGSEVIVILVLALVILGPEKLPEAMRKAGRAWAELRKMSTGFQEEVRKGFEEPVREVKKTADTVRSAATFTDNKPRYNPAKDPKPQLPAGSSVAEPEPQAAEPDSEIDPAAVDPTRDESSPVASGEAADATP
jgi:sec-independent protein translocase protein TatB